AAAVPPGLSRLPGHLRRVLGAGGRGLASRRAGRAGPGRARRRRAPHRGAAPRGASSRGPAARSGHAGPHPAPEPLSLGSRRPAAGDSGRAAAVSGRPLAERLDAGARRPVGILRLPDGRWLVARQKQRRLGHGSIFVILGLLAVAVAIGAFPVVRRLTRRLERLRLGVEGLGAGDLRARVPVEGKDEVAGLATSFNRAADRIEALVGAQRTLLASASHELRSPLARIRVALELMGAERPDLRDRVARDIAELDELIGELLLASRLQTVEELDRREDVDLLGLVAEEAARHSADVSGESVTVRGDGRLLRRLVRNLLENAARHGAPPVEATVSATGDRVHVRVCDRGPGVPEAEREKIFAPFYRPSSRAPADIGSGLGLALVREIARRHGGEVRCEGRDGGGTCFVVELPRV